MDRTPIHGEAPPDRLGSPQLLGRAWRWLGRRRLGRELASFAAIGVASTAAYALLYLVLRTGLGPAVANAMALLITAIGNTAANRRLTFGVRGGRSMLRDQAGGLVALGVALVITTAAVSLLAALVPHAGRALELAVLVLANALATVARFVLLRTWIAGDRRGASQPAPLVPRIQP
jgi:putative flippase GtrA